MFVAPEIHAGALARRRELCEEGSIVITLEELANIAAAKTDEEAALNELEMLVTG